MTDQDDSAEKSHEPSPRKLEKAREKGEIARAPDMLTATAYLGILICAVTVGTQSLLGFSEALMPLIEQPDRMIKLFFRDGSVPVAGGLMFAAINPALPILLFPGALVLVFLFSTQNLLFTGSKLKPKISRLSPIENAKNKYGRRGLFEFFKSFVKLSVYSIFLGFFIYAEAERIIGTSRAEPIDAVATLLSLIVKFLSFVVLIAMSIGLIDFFWQRADHMRRNRMSDKEMRDEFKDAEGDPHVKAQRRQRGQEIALSQMMNDVAEADVVIVNPTHFAVALKWTREPGSAPVCVGKGQDAIALRIREIAAEAGVPIHSDPPTARAVFATTDIGQQISREHFRAVAAAIRFADAMQKRVREKGWG